MSMMKKVTVGGPFVALLLLAGASPVHADQITITFLSTESKITIVILGPTLKTNVKYVYTITDTGNKETASGNITGTASTTSIDNWVSGDWIEVVIKSATAPYPVLEDFWVQAPSFQNTATVTYTVTSVTEGGPSPEPTSILLLGTGLLTILGLRRKLWDHGH